MTDFETQQQLQAKHDAEERQRQQELAAAMEQLQDAQDVPGPEAAGAPPMTAAQRAAIYGDDPNAPARTSEVTQAQAEAKQKALAREKQQQDAINSDTVAIDFEHPSSPASSAVAQQTAHTGSDSEDRESMRPAARRPRCKDRTQRQILWLHTTSIPMKANSTAFTRVRFWRGSSPTTSTAVSAGRS